jgi:DNA-binding response OmpR family regulator
MIFYESDFNEQTRKGRERRVKQIQEEQQRILVVEDDDVIRRLNTEALIYQGFKVDAADSAIAGWEAMQIYHYDLLVTDNNMPGMTGIELVEKMRGNNFSMPVVMATGTPPQQQFAENQWEMPVVVLKPYNCSELIEAVRTALRRAAEAMTPFTAKAGAEKHKASKYSRSV